MISKYSVKIQFRRFLHVGLLPASLGHNYSYSVIWLCYSYILCFCEVIVLLYTSLSFQCRIWLIVLYSFQTLEFQRMPFLCREVSKSLCRVLGAVCGNNSSGSMSWENCRMFFWLACMVTLVTSFWLRYYCKRGQRTAQCITEKQGNHRSG